MRHDRSALNARGGQWPKIADAFRAEVEAIIARRPSLPKPIEECHLLARRRKELGLTYRKFAETAGIAESTIYTVEIGTAGAAALRRYRAGLEMAERLAKK